MERRRLTLRRLDPWSMLKFGFLVNIVLLAVGILAGLVFWFFVRRLGIIETACQIADQVGYTECGVNGEPLFRAFVLLGLIWLAMQTAALVFVTMLLNLIADVVGGIKVTIDDPDLEEVAGQRAEEPEPATLAEPAQPPPPREPAGPPAPPPQASPADMPTERHQPVPSGRGLVSFTSDTAETAPRRRRSRPADPIFDDSPRA